VAVLVKAKLLIMPDAIFAAPNMPEL